MVTLILLDALYLLELLIAIQFFMIKGVEPLKHDVFKLQASLPLDALYPVKDHVYGHKSHKAPRASKGVKLVDFQFDYWIKSLS